MEFNGIAFEPIIPIYIMAIFCVVLLVFKRRGVMPYIRQIICVILLFIINLRPMYPSDNITVMSSKMDLNVVFVVDDTISMLGDDQDGYNNRLERAKADMLYIMENLPGAKFCVIAFNNNTHVMTPFTDSIDYIRNAIDSIYPLSPTYATGTNISVCIDSVEDVLDDLTEDEESNRQVVLFFMSDGENTDGNRVGNFSDIGEYIAGGAVMGYGTDRGGHMTYYNQVFDEDEPVYDFGQNAAQLATTRLDEDNLRSVASDLDVPYIEMNHADSFDTILADIREMHETDPEEEVKQGYVDFYYVFVIPLAALVAYEFISLKRRG